MSVSGMEYFEIDIAEQLLQIFPNLNRDIIEISIKHPSNRSTPLNVTSLVQNCIDDLLELRTYTETTGTRNVAKVQSGRNSSEAVASNVRNVEGSYRDNPYVIHSDDSNDEDMIHFAEKVDAGLFHDLSSESSPDDCVIKNPVVTTVEKGIMPSKLQVKKSVTLMSSPPVSPIKKASFIYNSSLKEAQINGRNFSTNDASPAEPSTWNEWRKTKNSEIDSDLPNLISPSAFKKKINYKSESENNEVTPVLSISQLQNTRVLVDNDNQTDRQDDQNNDVIASSSHGNRLPPDDEKNNFSQNKTCPTVSLNKILPNFSKSEIRNSGEIPGVKFDVKRSVPLHVPVNIGNNYRTPTYLNESESTDSSEDDELPVECITVQEVANSGKVSAGAKLDLEATLNDLNSFSGGRNTEQKGNSPAKTDTMLNRLNNSQSTLGSDTYMYKGCSQKKEIDPVSKDSGLKIFRTVANDTNTVDIQNHENNFPSGSTLDLNKTGPGSVMNNRDPYMKQKKAETITTTTEDTLVFDNPQPGSSRDNTRPSMVKYETEIKQNSCVLKIKRVIETNHIQDDCPVSVSTTCTIASQKNNNSLNPEKPCVIKTNTGCFQIDSSGADLMGKNSTLNNATNESNKLHHRKRNAVVQQGSDGENGRYKMKNNLSENGRNVLDKPHHTSEEALQGNGKLNKIETNQVTDTTSKQKTNEMADGWMNVNAMKSQQNRLPVVTKFDGDLPTATKTPKLENQVPESTILTPEPTKLIPESTIIIPEPEPEELTPEKQVLALFPDIDPEYLKRLINQDIGNIYDINNICNHLLEINYPKKQQQNNVPASVLQQKKKCNKNYYKDYTSIVMERQYFMQVETLLQNEFRWISVKDIRVLLKHFNGHYAPSHKVLREVMLKRQKDAEKDLKPNSSAKVEITFKVGEDKEIPLSLTFLKCPRTSRHLSSIVPELQQEIDFVADSLLELAEENDRQLAFQINEHEYEDTGQLIECGCCYGEIAFENMVQCYEGHLFCQDCLKNYAKESVFGQGKADLLCMTEGCDATFPVSQLSKALPSNILEKYEDRVKEENINLADLADLVRCPHCEFAALMDPGDKVFKCQSSFCMKETCRYCKEEWNEHFGKRCEEIEKKDETKLRLEFEEKMTEVQIRTCHRCKARFTKSEGCNKMTCRCGASMCYICRQPNISYQHFCQHVRNPGKPCDQCEDCFLWSNPEEDEKRAIEEIRKQANDARMEKGYTEDKYIGAKDVSTPPVKKQRLS